MKPLLIVNPRSGGGRTGKIFPNMRRTIEDALGSADVEYTSRKGHAIELARVAVDQGCPLVVAVGGDGTLNEVCNGVMRSVRRADTQVGLIGQGTGGDFRRTLGVPHRLDRYLDVLRSGRERALDVGKFRFQDHGGQSREHYFVNILSAGMGGLVDQYVANAPMMFGGTAAYFLSSLRALVNCRAGHLRARVTLGGATTERRLKSYLIAICNGQFFGSGMHVAPMAVVDDGVFEVVSLGAPSKLAFAVGSRKIYGGAHLGESWVEHFRCDAIELEVENPRAREVFLLDVDGEPLGAPPLSVELVRGGLRLRG